MVVVGDVIVSKVIERLVEVGFNYAADQYFARRRRMKDELERLNDALPRIQAVVEAADQNGQREITGALKKWLWQLKDAVHMADDVLDDLDYLQIEKQVGMNVVGRRPDGRKVRGFISDSKQKVSKFSKRAFKSDPTLNKLRGAVKRLNEVAVGVKDFMSTLQEFDQLQQQHHHQTQIAASSNRETGPILRDSNVLGRDKERKEVLQWLMRMPGADEDHKESISLFSIVGLGGVGKTTLVQLVYEDEDDNLKGSFDIKLWACVSTPFDVKKIMGDILECGTKGRPEVGGLGPLGEALKAMVSSKKFLLVLDDAWDDGDLSRLETLFAPLRSGLKGSKILLTTRSEKVAEKATVALGGSVNKPILRLEPLHSDVFLSLFNRYAFAGVNPRDYRKLELLGKQIAGRLGGLPLAAKTIGVLLRSNLDEGHWKNILQSSHILDHAQQRDDVMPVLMLSYRYLPTHLRPCFALCSIFPQDHEFIKDDLVLMWMALNFIQQSPQNLAEILEDIGSRYFDELAKLSFFEPRGMYPINPMTGRGESAYIMHDLLHDLACKVSHDECFRFVGGMSINRIPKTVRHLYFETNDIGLLKDMDKWKNLHTLILEFDGYIDEYVVTFEQVFESLKSIRVLSITVEGMEVLPDVMGKLRHLRYLSIGHRITRLPCSIYKLYHLQGFACREIDDTDTPSVLVLKNLINLRHLLPWDVCYVNIDGIGTLTSLQRLFFDAGAYKLSELKDLGELQELFIIGLKNDQHGEEVSLLLLDGKKRLHRLGLCWSDDNSDWLDGNSDLEKEYEKVLDCLHPPDSLKQLEIEGYQGARSPYWMEQESLKNLEEIVLFDNTAWEHLPFLGKLPYLNKLELTFLTALKQIGFEGGFQQLKILKIRCCWEWEEWSGLEAAEAASPCWPLLEDLSIERCPKLKALPPLPLSLKRLWLENVGLYDSPTLCLTTPSSSSPSLYEMKIERCEKLTSVADLLRHRLTALEDLLIRDCPKLNTLPFLPLGLKRLELENVGLSDSPTFCLATPSSSTPSLNKMEIKRCKKLTSVAGLLRHRLTSLVELDIRGCEALVDLHAEEGFQHLNSVEVLRIENCPKLKMATDAVAPTDCFPLSSLKSLYFEHCGELDRLFPALVMQGALTSLSVLELRGCNHVTSFPSEEACRRLTSLTWLNLAWLEELTSVEGLKALSHLHRLCIFKCPKLVQAAAAASSASNKGKEEEEFPLTVGTLWIDDPLLLHIEPLRKLASVEHLTIRDCRNLECGGDANSWLLRNRTSLQFIYLYKYTAKLLPCSLRALSSLRELYIYEACGLQSLPQMPSSLQALLISDCNETLILRCLEDEGADWPNIKHIPCVDIKVLRN